MLTISNPAGNELESVLRFCFRHVPDSELSLRTEHILKLFAAGQIDLNGIFQAKYGDTPHNSTLVGGMYAQNRQDGSVMLFVPAIKDGFPPDMFSEPLENYCRLQNAFAAVALADRNQPFDEKAFCRTGQFRFLSDLIHLAVQITPERCEPADPLQFIPLSSFSESVSERLVPLVKATYEDSRDFPALMQMASVEHVLQGYKTGVLYRPDLWFFIRYAGADAGVLLLTDTAPDQMELTYMGLIQSVRRKGLSRKIVQFAKQTAGMMQRSLLLTSADEKNVPAIQSYLSQGFQAWDRKRIFARFF